MHPTCQPRSLQVPDPGPGSLHRPARGRNCGWERPRDCGRHLGSLGHLNFQTAKQDATSPFVGIFKKNSIGREINWQCQHWDFEGSHTRETPWSLSRPCLGASENLNATLGQSDRVKCARDICLHEEQESQTHQRVGLKLPSWVHMCQLFFTYCFTLGFSY